MSGLEFGETPGDLGPGNQFYKNATPSGDPYIDGLLFFRQWKVAEITFSFPTSGAFYEYTNEPSGFVAANSANIAAFRDALREISRVTPLTFAELTETSSQHAILRLGATTVDGNFPAAYYPDDSAQAGDVWLKANSGDPDWETPVAGNRGWTVMRHELGHAFGLKHPFEDIAPEFPMMPADRNFKEFTVMAYNGFMAGNGVNFADFQPTTYMIYDIAALQHLYGANFNFRSGDTTYAFDPNTGEMTINGLPQGAPFINRIFMTIWDGGGADTFDLSAYSNDLVVDLEPGSWSVFSPAQLAGHPGYPHLKAVGNVFNALQYHGDPRSLIENVIGGSGDDDISGNAAGNLLKGGAGADVLRGWGGRDNLIGDDDNDLLFGYGSHDSLYGGNGDDDLRGGFGRDLLNGSGGNDVARGGLGDDRIFGGGGADTLFGNEGDDSLTGGGGGDRLKGDAGDDTLNGRFGDDTVSGGAGDDLFEFRQGHGNDVIDDFTAGAASEDVVRLIGFGAAFDSFAEVLAASSQIGANVVIDFGGGDSITLENTTLARLHADDFTFG